MTATEEDVPRAGLVQQALADHRDRPLVSVVVPTRNESGNVAELLRRLDAGLGTTAAEIVFVDDSDDDTPQQIIASARDCGRVVRVVHRGPGERAGGLGSAVVAGFRTARSPWAVVMDGDLQHPPELIPALLRAGEDHDLVVASRYCGEGDAGGLAGEGRVVVSGLATAAAKAAFPRRLHGVSDPMSGFFAVRLAALDLERLRPTGFKILLEVVARTGGLRIAEVPFTFGERFAGESKASLAEGMRFVRHVAELRSGRMWPSRRAWRALLFGLVGLTGLGVNLAFVWLFDLQLHLHYALAAALATQASTTWLFLLTDLGIFRRRRTRSWPKRYLAFSLLNNTVLLMRLPFLALLVALAHMPHLSANLCTLVAAFAVRFFVVDRFVYPSEDNMTHLAQRPVNGAARPVREGPVRVTVDVARATPDRRQRPAYLPYKYDVAGIVSIGSEVLLPELEYFRAQRLGNDVDIELRVRPVGRGGLRGRSVVTRSAEPATTFCYEEHLGNHGSNFRIEMGERISVTVAPLLARSPHVIYTNIVEALLRFTMVARGHVLLHSACVELDGRGLMLSARTDTGKTGTILRLLRERGARFLSDDMTIVRPDGQVFAYPKPLTISQHTLRAVDSTVLSRGEWALLRLQSRIHSKEGRNFGQWLASHNIPIMGVNAVTQIAVPPPKYAADRLVPCDLVDTTVVENLVIIERGPYQLSELDREAAIDELIDNTDDAYGFPPFRYLAPSICLAGMGYAELRQRERDLLAQALRRVRTRRLATDDFSWADRIPDLVAPRTGVVELSQRLGRPGPVLDDVTTSHSSAGLET